MKFLEWVDENWILVSIIVFVVVMGGVAAIIHP